MKITISDGEKTVELEESPGYVWIDYTSCNFVSRLPEGEEGDIPDTLMDWLKARTPLTVAENTSGNERSVELLAVARDWYVDDPKALYVKLKFGPVDSDAKVNK